MWYDFMFGWLIPKIEIMTIAVVPEESSYDHKLPIKEKPVDPQRFHTTCSVCGVKCPLTTIFYLREPILCDDCCCLL
jgi:hypothetical protein